MQHHGAPDGEMMMLRSSCTIFARSFARADGLPVQQRALRPTATAVDGGCVPATAGCHGAFECMPHAAQLSMLMVTAERPPAYVGGRYQSTCVAGAARICENDRKRRVGAAIKSSRADRHPEGETVSRQVSVAFQRQLRPRVPSVTLGCSFVFETFSDLDA